MTARIVNLSGRRRRQDAKLRGVLAEVRAIAAAGVDGTIPIDEAVHRINRAIQPAVVATLRGPA